LHEHESLGFTTDNKKNVILKGGLVSRTAKAGCNPERSPLRQAIQPPGHQLQKSPAPRPAPEMGNFHLQFLLPCGGNDNNSYYTQELKHLLISNSFSKILEERQQVICINLQVVGSGLRTASLIKIS